MAEISKPSGVDLNKIWGKDNPETPPSDSKIATGWVVEIPDVEDFQWLDNKMDTFIAHVNQHGIPEWDSTTEYQTNKSYIMGSNGTIYRCILTHTNKNPVSAPDASSYWREAFDAADTSYTKSESDTFYARRANNLSDLNNVVSARTNLGLGSAATRNVGTGGGNLMEVGAFGLGHTTTLATGNWNNLVVTGFYRGNNLTNSPVSGWVYVIHLSYDNTNYFKQIAFDLTGTSNRMFIRMKQNGSWTGWVENFTTGNFDPSTKFNTTGGWVEGQVRARNNPSTIGWQNGQLVAETSIPNSTPMVSWHRSGTNAATVYLDLNSNLNILDSGGSSGQLWDNRRVSFSSGVNGYIRFPNGFMIQWGVASASPSGVTVLFPISFPNACRYVSIGQNSIVTEHAVQNANHTGFTYYAGQNTSNNFWTAGGF